MASKQKLEFDWKFYVERENLKALQLRDKIVSRSMRPPKPNEFARQDRESKIMPREDDLRTSYLNISGWPQSKLQTCEDSQDELWIETVMTTPGAEHMYSLK